MAVRFFPSDCRGLKFTPRKLYLYNYSVRIVKLQKAFDRVRFPILPKFAAKSECQSVCSNLDVVKELLSLGVDQQDPAWLQTALLHDGVWRHVYDPALARHVQQAVRGVDVARGTQPVPVQHRPRVPTTNTTHS